MAQSTSSVSIDTIKDQYPQYSGQIKHRKRIPPQQAETVPADQVLEDQLADNFEYDELFTHQADALNSLAAGDDVCVSTSTSSGKTAVYALQIARHHLQNEDNTSLLIYPTKALSRDQEDALTELYDDLDLDITVSVYDGDTPSGNPRKEIRRNADVIITNFTGINTYLADHSLWDRIYSNLELVVIDESHSYTGIHGMHVAWTIRRLRRVIDYYGGDPQFVLTSATIGNPAEHSKHLTGKDVTVINNDGSPQGEQEIVFWKPPDKNPDQEDSVQRRADKEASELLAHLGYEGLQTLMFTRSRKQTEINAKRATSAANDYPDPEEISITSYNAGHGKTDRRAVEDKLKQQDIDGVVTTNALELGIDIGSVDATILTGYPGTRQSFWQQLGRAGRNKSAALGVFVTQEDSIDQYILNNPDYLLDNSNIEDAMINLDNNVVYARHVLCASEELPLGHDDQQWFGTRLSAAVRLWKDAGLMVGTLDGGVQYNGPPRPQRSISLYATDDEQFEIRCKNADISLEPISKERAYRDYHEGAVVVHKGKQYTVEELVDNKHNQYVTLKESDVPYYTQSLSEKEITNITVQDHRDLTDHATLYYGTGTVEITYDAYKKLYFNGSGDDQIYEINLPPIELQTQLVWVEIDSSYRRALSNEYRQQDDESPILGGLHALEHGIISLAPLELRMDKDDLGGLSQLQHPERNNNATFFIYDGVEGGVGFAKGIYEQFDSILERTNTMIEDCGCHGTDGCPSCVMEHSCGSNNSPLHTHVAQRIGEYLLSG